MRMLMILCCTDEAKIKWSSGLKQKLERQADLQNLQTTKIRQIPLSTVYKIDTFTLTEW